MILADRLGEALGLPGNGTRLSAARRDKLHRSIRPAVTAFVAQAQPVNRLDTDPCLDRARRPLAGDPQAAPRR